LIGGIHRMDRLVDVSTDGEHLLALPQLDLADRR
jgi:hypothetical protein